MPGGLQYRLHSPETHVQEMEGGRAVVTIGPWPKAGDTSRGDSLPDHRELARALEPCWGPEGPPPRRCFGRMRWRRNSGS
ncbi:type VI immunity family protein [Cystobacter fuscus]